MDWCGASISQLTLIEHHFDCNLVLELVILSVASVPNFTFCLTDCVPLDFVCVFFYSFWQITKETSRGNSYRFNMMIWWCWCWCIHWNVQIALIEIQRNFPNFTQTNSILSWECSLSGLYIENDYYRYQSHVFELYDSCARTIWLPGLFDK